MTLALIPQPRRLRFSKGSFRLPRKGWIAIPDSSFVPLIRILQTELKSFQPASGYPPAEIRFEIDATLESEAYRLQIRTDGITLTASSVDGARHGSQTLLQIIRQIPNRELPSLKIEDWPEFPDRGLYYDQCRGRVDTVATHLRNLEHLAACKLNHLEFYIKHTFHFRGHPLIGKNCGRFEPEELIQIDAACQELGIDFVPSLSSFGHMDRILEHKPYHHLAEDFSKGKWVADEADAHHPNHGWTLSPAVPEIYPFIESLYDEFLPIFSSDRVNVCCDETFDLGWGQSHEICKKLGKGRVFLNHVLKLREIAAKYGKRILIWGDVIRNYPELLPELPDDVTVINWGYRAIYPEKTIEKFQSFPGKVLSSPSSISHCVLYGAANFARDNIRKHVRAGRTAGIEGILNTCWGDAGMFCPFYNSFFGTAFAAEQSWNPNADRKSFTARFCKVFLNCDDPKLLDAVEKLHYYSSIHWYFVFFHYYGMGPFTEPLPWMGEGDSIYLYDSAGKRHLHRLDAKLGKSMAKALDQASESLDRFRETRGIDPHGMLPYWIFGADCYAHVARKLTVLGQGGKDTKAGRQSLINEMRSLQKRFVRLWNKESKESELRLNIEHFEGTIEALRSGRLKNESVAIND